MGKTEDSTEILFICVLGTVLAAKYFSSFLNSAYQGDTKPLLSEYSGELLEQLTACYFWVTFLNRFQILYLLFSSTF